MFEATIRKLPGQPGDTSQDDVLAKANLAIRLAYASTGIEFDDDMCVKVDCDDDGLTIVVESEDEDQLNELLQPFMKSFGFVYDIKAVEEVDA